MTIDLSAAHERNTKKIDATNAAEIDGMLTYLSLCDRYDIRTPSGMAFNGAYLYTQEIDVDPGVSVKRSNREMIRSFDHHGLKFVQSVDRDYHYPKEIVAEALKDEAINDLYDLSIVHLCNRDATRVMAERDFGDLHWKLSDSQAFIIAMYGVIESGIIVSRGSLVGYNKSGHIYVPDYYEDYEAAAAISVITKAAIQSYAVRSRWSVDVRMGQGLPAVGFVTDSTGVREMFRFREKPEGAARRDALIHWVATHWRQTRHDPDSEIYVREHLRGKKLIQWHGMEARINLPETDLVRSTESVENRKRLSQAQLDRRRRNPRQ